ncbi:MAG: hypothetical protein E7277_00410 [Lachnospiraceae bacterium]|nr:hypothetical protein [Lachnospiraceae bacterium]
MKSTKFSNYMKQRMARLNIPARYIYYGIIDKKGFYRILNDEYTPNFWITNHLLSRMGVNTNSLFQYVNSKDFKAISLRNEIVYALNRHEYSAVSDMLENNWLPLCHSNTLLLQFYYTVKVMLSSQNGNADSITLSYVESALSLTLPNFTQIDCLSYCLSYQELDLLLDFYHYSNESSSERFLEIYHYVNKRCYDSKCASFVQPKALVYYLQCTFTSNESLELSKAHALVSLCQDTLTLLKKNNSTYFLVEIHNYLIKLLRYLFNQTADTAYLSLLNRSELLLQTLDYIESILACSFKTTGSSIIYSINRIEDICQTIHVRRKTLGLTRPALCEEICNLTTLKRIEGGHSSPYSYTRDLLFQKLRLPTEALKDSIIVENDVQRQRLSTYRQLVNQAKWDEAKQLLDELSAACDLQDKYTLQSVLRMYDSCHVEKNHLPPSDSQETARFNLELTLPLEKIEHASQLYFTQNELLCFLDYVRACPSLSKKKTLRILENYMNQFSESERQTNWLFRNELILSTLLDEYLNLKDLEMINKYLQALLQASIVNKRSYFFSDLLYLLEKLDLISFFPSFPYHLLSELASNNYRLTYYKNKI